MGGPSAEHTVDAVLAALARRNLGLVTRREAIAAGVPSHGLAYRIRSGRLESVQPGVYRLAGVPSSWRQQVLAAALAGGPAARASHRAAVVLWKFEGARPGPIDVCAPRWNRRPRGAQVVAHETQDLVPTDASQVDGIPVTTALRTLLDVGCLVSPIRLEAWVDEGLRRGMFTLEQLRTRHRQIARPGRNGCGPMGELLRARDSSQRRAESGFEVRLSRLLEQHGWRRPERQYEVRDDRGAVIGRADLAYPRFRILMEADSETWHVGSDRFHRDRHRRNLLRAVGFEILEYTWHHVHHDVHHVLATLTAVAQRQGRLLGRDPRELRQ